MDWAQLEDRQPGLARLGRQRLLDPGVVLVATIRGDGTPRVSPVEPFVLDGTLWLSMLWQSCKAADLLRDPRVLVHSVVTSRDGGEGEFKIRGTARAEDDPDVSRRYAAVPPPRTSAPPSPLPTSSLPVPSREPASLDAEPARDRGRGGWVRAGCRR